MTRPVLAAFCLAFAMPLAAQQTMPPAPFAYRQLEDPAQEAAAQELMETLRCLKCQSQSIADSDAPMAGGRVLVSSGGSGQMGSGAVLVESAPSGSSGASGAVDLKTGATLLGDSGSIRVQKTSEKEESNQEGKQPISHPTN